MTVGQAARRAGLTPKAIRLYEGKGLVAPAPRTQAGYRLYQEQDVQRLQFVRQARTLGLNLAEIREVIDLQRGGAQPCERVLGIVEARLEEIDRAVRDLQGLKRVLRRARETARQSRSRGAGAVICRIIESAGVGIGSEIHGGEAPLT